MNKNKNKNNKWEIQRFITVDEYLTIKYLTVTVNANNSPLVDSGAPRARSARVDGAP